ncbi:MAG: hydrogenase maturation nickel metallochaperone HypA [Candidatus Kryptoniota bacterium]
MKKAGLRNQMHELSIAESIMNIVNENLVGNRPVISIKVRIGSLANIISDSLEFCFDVIKKGTPIEKAELKIESVVIMAHCEICGTDFEIEDFLFRCKNCGSTDLRIVSGNELQVVEIEVEDEIEESA